ncbi:hypothetical protein DMJ13_14585 [halophilic archaeon]|nr:hypothetical protein DMJ13_14585 [halophilic archaeon]
MFGKPDAMPEEFEMSVIAVLLPEQVESVAESEQQLAVGLADTSSLTGFDTRPEGFDALSRIGHTGLYMRL